MHIEALTAGFLNYDFYAIPDGAEQRRGVFRNIQTTALAVVEIFKFPVEPSHLFSPSQLLSVAGWIDTQRLIGLLGALSRALFLLARFFFQDRFFRYRERMPEGAVKILELVRAIATGRYGRYRFGLNLRLRFRVCLHLVSSYRCLAVAVHPIYSSDARFIPGVTVWENAVATRKLPKDLFRGEMDAWWEVTEDGRQLPTFIGELRRDLQVDKKALDKLGMAL